MQRSGKKCIALVDWAFAGHHPTFFSEFALGLEERGFEVLALCPDPDGARELVEAGRARADADRPNSGTVHFIKVEDPVYKLSGIRPRRIAAIYSATLKFKNLERQVRREGNLLGLKAQAIFYSSIYTHQFEWIRYASLFLRLPWTGLYLQAESLRLQESSNSRRLRRRASADMFSIRSCKSIGILDENLVESLARLTRKPVIRVPDPARRREPGATIPANPAKKLIEFAAGRPVVGLLGHLRSSKGILTFLEAARISDPSRICFALVGESAWLDGSSESRIVLHAESDCSNLWMRIGRISTESDFDSFVSSCDILAAAYVDFPHSSNILAKAAVFEKPVIVSEGLLMAERVRRFRSGEIVAQSNAVDFLKAVYSIAGNRKEWVERMKPDWEAYRCEHSFQNLRNRISDLIAPIFPELSDSVEGNRGVTRS